MVGVRLYTPLHFYCQSVNSYDPQHSLLSYLLLILPFQESLNILSTSLLFSYFILIHFFLLSLLFAGEDIKTMLLSLFVVLLIKDSTSTGAYISFFLSLQKLIMGSCKWSKRRKQYSTHHSKHPKHCLFSSVYCHL